MSNNIFINIYKFLYVCNKNKGSKTKFRVKFRQSELLKGGYTCRGGDSDFFTMLPSKKKWKDV